MKDAPLHEPMQRQAARRVRNVMTTDPANCTLEDTAQQAARIMKEKDSGIVPVVDNHEHRRLIGVITDRDLCLRIVAEGLDAKRELLRNHLSADIIACHSDDTVDHVVALMEENQVRRIPVVNNENRLEGIVSLADIFSRSNVEPQRTHETMEKISEPNAPAGELGKVPPQEGTVIV